MTSTVLTPDAPTPPLASSARPRIEGLDVLRLACALGVTILHVAAQAELVTGKAYLGVYAEAMRWAVPTLFVISGILAGSAVARGFWSTLGRRASRLMVPYVVWLAIYTTAAWVVDRTPVPGWFDLVFHGGTAYGAHLWFLPTLLLCVPFGLLLRDRRAILVAVLIGAGLLLARALTGWVTPLDWSVSAEYPFLNWLEIYLLGVAIGSWTAGMPLRGKWVGWALPSSVLLAVAVSATVALTVGSRSAAGYIVLTVTAMVLALAAYGPLRLSATARLLCDTAMGIYLIHPLLLAAFGRVLPPTALPSAVWLPVMSALDFGASALLTIGILRVAWLKRIVA